MPEVEALDPSKWPTWALALILAGWLFDRIFAGFKYLAEKRNETDQTSQGLALQRLTQEVHDSAVIIQARDPEGKPLVWSAKGPILDRITELRDDTKEVKGLVQKNHRCIQTIERELGVACTSDD